MKTKTLIILIILIAVGAGIFFCYKNLLLPEKEIEEEIEEGETIRKPVSLPASYQIQNILYYSVKDKCYLASAMILLKFYGLSEEKVQEFKYIVEKEGQGGPPDIFLGFKKFNLSDRLRLGYAKDFTIKHPRFYQEFQINPQEQIIKFESQEQAFTQLKKLISSDIPVMVFLGEDEDYTIAIGYDKNNIYLYHNETDGQPTIKSLSRFLREWITPPSGHFEFWGNWGMIWLAKE